MARNTSKKRRGKSRKTTVLLENIPTPDELIEMYLEDVRNKKPIASDTWRDEQTRKTADRLFGDWDSFQRTIFEKAQGRYTDEYLFAKVRHYFYSYGKRPTMRSWTDPPSITYVLTRYEKWLNFLEAAGIDADQLWTDEMLIKLLHKAYEDLDRSPTTLDLLQEPSISYLPSYMVFVNHFGKVKTDEKGKPTKKSVVKPDRLHGDRRVHTTEKELASWNEVLERAGLPPLPKPDALPFSDEDLIEHVKRVAAITKRAPRPKDIRILYEKNLELRKEAQEAGLNPDEEFPHLPSESAYYNGGRFEKWADVMEEAGLLNQWLKETHYPDPSDDPKSVEIMKSLETATKLQDGVHVPTLEQYHELRRQHKDKLISFYYIKKLYKTYGAAVTQFLRITDGKYEPSPRIRRSKKNMGEGESE